MLTDNRYIKISSIYSLFSKISASLVSYPLELKILQNSDIITTVSNSIADELKNEYSNSDEIVTVGNGVDEKFFSSTQKKYKNNNKYIFFAGRIDREKGLFDFIESAKYVCNMRKDIFFYIAGLGRDLNKLKRKVKKANLQDRIKFFGQVDKTRLHELYKRATLFVLPSYHEGIPTVILEAMSCKLPVIATDVRGNRDVIKDGENGIMVPPRNPIKLAKVIISLIDDKQLLKILGKNARKTIEEKYTWDIVSKRYLKCYELLMEDNS
jgi:glycosyltransferase involved in cell wall biosynthesis